MRCGELQNSRITSRYTPAARAHTHTHPKHAKHAQTAIVSLRYKLKKVFSIIQKRGEPLNCRGEMRRTSKLAYCALHPCDTPHMLKNSQNRQNRRAKTAIFPCYKLEKGFSIIQERSERLHCHGEVRRTSKLAYCIPATHPTCSLTLKTGPNSDFSF